jgi:hypothetical protein
MLFIQAALRLTRVDFKGNAKFSLPNIQKPLQTELNTKNYS